MSIESGRIGRMNDVFLIDEVHQAKSPVGRVLAQGRSGPGGERRWEIEYTDGVKSCNRPTPLILCFGDTAGSEKVHS